jgi:hypothetical protein
MTPSKGRIPARTIARHAKFFAHNKRANKKCLEEFDTLVIYSGDFYGN